MASEVLESEPMTREEAKRILRRLELDAYSAIVTAFRAQGDISKTKKSILTELSNELSISTERHRAEVRRVVNDDRLSAVAECMYGSGTSTEWSIEGRRLVSLMPRLVPQTVFTAKATAAANQTVELNQKLPTKTEIEVLPLPTKPKGLPKNDVKEDVKDGANSVKVEDKAKKKKKTVVPYSKPSPIALNKSLTNSFKPAAPTLKPIIKSSTVKYSANTTVSKTTVSSPSNTTAKYSPKPIILQKSPTKSQGNVSRPNLHLQSLSSSTVSSSSLTSLSSLSSSKPENSLHLIQSPMIKVVSNSLNSTLNTTSVSSIQNNSITQKIKFKTPLPKPKVKAAKFKPMVPLQRPGLLSSSQSNDVIGMGSSSAAPTSVSPVKSTSGMQGMSVKVVQVAKSGISGSLGSSSLINYSNKPVVVVPSSAKTPPHKVLSFSSISSATTQPVKVSTAHTSPPLTTTLQKGALSSKSMPLATGFKMIAVTTVVPGTTQVKTVYIATPIMSLTKTVSQTTSSSITTPATQNKHSSLASNHQSVVARSMNAAILNQTAKYHGMQNMLRATTIASSITTPTFAVGKASQVTSSVAKGLGSLRTTLSGAAQSLKVFTAVSKNRPPICINNGTRNTPLLPSTTTILTSSSNLQNQRVSNIQVKSVDNNTQKNEKRHVVNVSHQSIYSNTVGNNTTAEQTNTHIPIQATIALNNYNDVGNALSILSEESLITTEQITASAVAENDDMAFLSAGEKFLEQLTAKMSANSPDGLINKNESFIFPSNMTLDVNTDRLTSNQALYEINKNNKFVGMVCTSDTTNISIVGDKIVSSNSLNNSNQLKNNLAVPPQKKDNTNSYILNPRIVSHNIGIVTTTKLSTQLLNNNICFMNSKITPSVSVASSTNCTEIVPKTVGVATSLSSSLVVSVSRANIQPKADIPGKAVVSYPTSSKDLSTDENIMPVTVTSIIATSAVTTLPEESNVVATVIANHTSETVSSSNKTPPAPTKLNISSFHNNGSNGSTMLTSSQQPPPPVTTTTTPTMNSEPATVNTNKSNINNSLFSVNNIQKNTAVDNVTSVQNNDKSSVLLSSIKSTLNIPSNMVDTETPMSNGTDDLTTIGKKRKIGETIIPATIPARTQASWIRGAANLLARVSRFRGTNKQKGEMNAASWFTKPVDPLDAPGYYRIIRNPMDFGKIKRKLEEGQYTSYPNFYDDMMLIKKNCYSYNPVGHVARKDCDDVFSFFEGEYQKLLERWEKHHVSPHKKAKICAEENGNGSAT